MSAMWSMPRGLGRPFAVATGQQIRQPRVRSRMIAWPDALPARWLCLSAALSCSLVARAEAQNAAVPMAEAPSASTVSEAASPSAKEGQVVALPAGSAWVRFLGWSTEGNRIAFRSGPQGAANRPGDPCTVLRVGPDGATQARLRVEGNTLKALGERRIHSVKPAAREAVTPNDVLLGAGETLFAVVHREAPAELAVLRKEPDGRYYAVWREALARSAPFDAWAWPSPTGTLWAIAIESGPETKKRAFLILVPTSAVRTADQP